MEICDSIKTSNRIGSAIITWSNNAVGLQPQVTVQVSIFHHLLIGSLWAPKAVARLGERTGSTACSEDKGWEHTQPSLSKCSSSFSSVKLIHGFSAFNGKILMNLTQMALFLKAN